MTNHKPTERKGYRWLLGNTISTFAAFSLLTLGAEIIQATLGIPEGLPGGWSTLAVVILVVICMVKERGSWSYWLRFIFVPGAWIAHAILRTFFSLTLAGSVAGGLGYPGFTDNLAAWLAALPVASIAMRRSWLFVVEKDSSKIH